MVMHSPIDAGFVKIDKYGNSLSHGDIVSAYVCFENIEESSLRLQTATFEKLSHADFEQFKYEIEQQLIHEPGNLHDIHQRYADFIAPTIPNPLKPTQLFANVTQESDLELIAELSRSPIYDYCSAVAQLSLDSRLQITRIAIEAAKRIRRNVLPLYRRYAQQGDARLKNQLKPHIEKVQNWIDRCPDLHEFALDQQHASSLQSSYMFFPNRSARSQYVCLDVDPKEFLFFEPYEGNVVASIVYKRKQCLLQEIDLSRIVGGEITLQRFAHIARSYLGELDMTRSMHEINLLDYSLDKPVFGKIQESKEL